MCSRAGAEGGFETRIERMIRFLAGGFAAPGPAKGAETMRRSVGWFLPRAAGGAADRIESAARRGTGGVARRQHQRDARGGGGETGGIAVGAGAGFAAARSFGVFRRAQPDGEPRRDGPSLRLTDSRIHLSEPGGPVRGSRRASHSDTDRVRLRRDPALTRLPKWA